MAPTIDFVPGMKLAPCMFARLLLKCDFVETPRKFTVANLSI